MDCFDSVSFEKFCLKLMMKEEGKKLVMKVDLRLRLKLRFRSSILTKARYSSSFEVNGMLACYLNDHLRRLYATVKGWRKVEKRVRTMSVSPQG